MSAPSTNPAGILPIADAASVPVPTQSDQDMSEVHGPIVRTADLRTGIVSSSLWSPTSIAPDDSGASASESRRHDPVGTYGPVLLQQNNLANVAVVISMAYLLRQLGMLSQGTDRSLIVPSKDIWSTFKKCMLRITTKCSR